MCYHVYYWFVISWMIQIVSLYYMFIYVAHFIETLLLSLLFIVSSFTSSTHLVYFRFGFNPWLMIWTYEIDEPCPTSASVHDGPHVYLCLGSIEWDLFYSSKKVFTMKWNALKHVNAISKWCKRPVVISYVFKHYSQVNWRLIS